MNSTSIGRNSRQFLESTIKRDFKIIIDACSLRDRNANNFWTNIIPILKKEGKKVIIPLSVYNEVKKYADNPAICHQGNPSHHNSHEKVVEVKQTIEMLLKNGLADMRGENEEKFADPVIIRVVAQHRTTNNLLIITQDKALTRDVERLSEIKSVETNKQTLVRYINKYGFLSRYNFD